MYGKRQSSNKKAASRGRGRGNLPYNSHVEQGNHFSGCYIGNFGVAAPNLAAAKREQEATTNHFLAAFGSPNEIKVKPKSPGLFDDFVLPSEASSFDDSEAVVGSAKRSKKTVVFAPLPVEVTDLTFDSSDDDATVVKPAGVTSSPVTSTVLLQNNEKKRAATTTPTPTKRLCYDTNTTTYTAYTAPTMTEVLARGVNETFLTLRPQLQVKIRRSGLPVSGSDGQFVSFERANWRQYYLTDEVLGEDAETERMSNEIYDLMELVSFYQTVDITGGPSRIGRYSSDTQNWYCSNFCPGYKCLKEHFRGNFAAFLTLNPGYMLDKWCCECLAHTHSTMWVTDPRDINQGHWDLEPKAGYEREYANGAYNSLPYATCDQYHSGQKGTKPKPTHFSNPTHFG
jgi:hypothetical protein